jgi:hypothetical protein
MELRVFWAAAPMEASARSAVQIIRPILIPYKLSCKFNHFI